MTAKLWPRGRLGRISSWIVNHNFSFFRILWPLSDVMIIFLCPPDLAKGSLGVNHYFWVCLWRCFQNKLAFALADLGKKMALTNHSMIIIQPIEGLNRTQRQNKGASSLNWDIYLLLSLSWFRTGLTINGSPGSNLNRVTPWAFSVALLIAGNSSASINHMSQFLYISH